MILHLYLAILCIAIPAICAAPYIRAADAAFHEHLNAARDELHIGGPERRRKAAEAHQVAQRKSNIAVFVASGVMIVLLAALYIFVPSMHIP